MIFFFIENRLYLFFLHCSQYLCFSYLKVQFMVDNQCNSVIIFYYDGEIYSITYRVFFVYNIFGFFIHIIVYFFIILSYSY